MRTHIEMQESCPQAPHSLLLKKGGAQGPGKLAESSTGAAFYGGLAVAPKKLRAPPLKLVLLPGSLQSREGVVERQPALTSHILLQPQPYPFQEPALVVLWGGLWEGGGVPTCSQLNLTWNL